VSNFATHEGKPAQGVWRIAHQETLLVTMFAFAFLHQMVTPYDQLHRDESTKPLRYADSNARENPWGLMIIPSAKGKNIEGKGL